MPRIRLAMMIFAGLAVAAFAGDLLHPPNSLRRKCHLPPYSYQSDLDRRSGRVLSFTGPIVNPNAAGAAGASHKIFSFNSEQLKVDHCKLRRLTLTVSSNGEWIINGDARQDVTMVPALDRPQFERFKRNRFHIILKLLAADRRAEDPHTVQTGTSVLYRIEPSAFWVDKGREESFRMTGPSGGQQDLKAVYPLLRGAEAEFYYE